MAQIYTDCHWYSFTLFNPMTSQDMETFSTEILGIPFDSFQLIPKKSRGYDRRYSLQDMVVIYTGGLSEDNANTSHIEIKGSAWDTLPSLNLLNVIDYVDNAGGREVRWDIYIDDCSNTVPVDELIDLSSKHKCKERMISFSRKIPRTTLSDSRTIEYGSKSYGEFFLQIYEKGVHENVESFRGAVDFSQTRFEMRLRNYEDIQEIKSELKSGVSLTKICKDLLNTKLAFVVDDPTTKKRNRELEPWWKEFLEGAEIRESVRVKLHREPAKETANFIAYTKKYLAGHGVEGREVLQRLAEEFLVFQNAA